jgi:hypothetical protein
MVRIACPRMEFSEYWQKMLIEKKSRKKFAGLLARVKEKSLIAYK